jgi:hypothetical protein
VLRNRAAAEIHALTNPGAKRITTEFVDRRSNRYVERMNGRFCITPKKFFLPATVPIIKIKRKGKVLAQYGGRI